MKQEKFKVIQFIRELLIMIDTQMDNFPKKDIELKNRIRTNSYDANTEINLEIKKGLLQKIIAKIKVMDFLLNLSYDKNIITEKKYYKFGNKMDDIVKYTSRMVENFKQHSLGYG